MLCRRFTLLFRRKKEAAWLRMQACKINWHAASDSSWWRNERRRISANPTYDQRTSSHSQATFCLLCGETAVCLHSAPSTGHNVLVHCSDTVC